MKKVKNIKYDLIVDIEANYEPPIIGIVWGDVEIIMEDESVLKSGFNIEFWKPVLEKDFSNDIIDYNKFIKQFEKKMLKELNDFLNKINPHMIGTIDFIKEKKND